MKNLSAVLRKLRKNNFNLGSFRSRLNSLEEADAKMFKELEKMGFEIAKPIDVDTNKTPYITLVANDIRVSLYVVGSNKVYPITFAY